MWTPRSAVRAEGFTGHDGHDPLRALTAGCDLHPYGFSPPLRENVNLRSKSLSYCYDCSEQGLAFSLRDGFGPTVFFKRLAKRE